MTIRSIPFYANTGDNKRCVQACFRMMLAYFLPEREFSWTELDIVSHKVEGKGTWWFPAFVEFEKLGIKTQMVSPFDYQRFYEKGSSYINSITTKEVAQSYIYGSNLLDVKHLIPEFLEQGRVVRRPATIADIDALLSDGWLVGIDCNERVLNGKSGFSSHMILIFDREEDIYIAHDPGLPAYENRRIAQDVLESSWIYAGKNKISLVAFRK